MLFKLCDMNECWVDYPSSIEKDNPCCLCDNQRQIAIIRHFQILLWNVITK